MMPLFAALIVVPAGFEPHDFAEYWAAGRLHLTGGDPYDGAQLRPLQVAIGQNPDVPAVMLWTPPWTLPLYWPFAALPPVEGLGIWRLVQMGCVAAAAVLAWRAYGGPGRLGLLVPVLLAAGFAPTWWLFAYAQNGGFVTLGLAGFVWAQGRGKPVTAGAFAALTAVKPHLLALFGLALVLDGFSRRGRPTLLAGIGVLAVLGAVALVPDPAVYRQFADALTRPATPETVPLAWWNVPTLSFRLRDWSAGGLTPETRGELFWVQFVPCLVGLVAVVPYWWVRRKTWDWLVEVPRLTFASLLLAPYGAWIFDLTLLLVPVAATAARLRHGPFLAGVGFAVGVVVVSLATLSGFVEKLHDMVWFTPAVLGLVAGTGQVLGRGVECPGPAGPQTAGPGGST